MRAPPPSDPTAFIYKLARSQSSAYPSHPQELLLLLVEKVPGHTDATPPHHTSFPRRTQSPRVRSATVLSFSCGFVFSSLSGLWEDRMDYPWLVVEKPKQGGSPGTSKRVLLPSLCFEVHSQASEAGLFLCGRTLAWHD